MKAALEWFRGAASAGKPRFLWVHVYDPHAPYEPPMPYGASFKDDLYLGEVAYTDASLAPLLEAVRSQKPAPLLVVTGDHGEARGDHGELTHGLFCYEATLHIPLFAWCPPLISSGREAVPARHVDIVPTVLDALGAPAATELPGQIAPAGVPPRARGRELFRVSLDDVQPGMGAAARNPRRRPEVHRPADPGALRPAHGSGGGEEPGRGTAGWPAPAAQASARAAEPGQRAGNGRLGGGRKAQEPGLSERARPRRRQSTGRDDDPKTLVAFDQKLHQMVELSEQEKYDEAIAIGRTVVADHPKMKVGYLHLAVMLTNKGSLEEAIRVYAKASAERSRWREHGPAARAAALGGRPPEGVGRRS